MKTEELKNAEGEIIVIGCNYHTNWQSNKSMRFVLAEVKDNKARLYTRKHKKRKEFWTDLDDLGVFIKTKHNIDKAKKINKNKTIMKTEIKRQYEEQISDMFQTVEDFSDNHP